MNDSKFILKLITNSYLAQTDVNLLDEIDARVWCFLNDKKFVHVDATGVCDEKPNLLMAFRYKDSESSKVSLISDVPQYTRSKSALKAIRPDDSTLSKMGIYLSPNGDDAYVCELIAGEKFVKSPLMHTEELAELYSIVWATAIERGEA